MRAAAFLTAMTAILPSFADDADPPEFKFGTTVVISSGLKGLVYHVPYSTEQLPNFRKMKPKGTIYTTSLNIPQQSFDRGFPGVTDRFEWFAIDYTGRFWIEKPGSYRFALLSDDGARLYIDDDVIIDNDGTHPPIEKTGTVELNTGVHRIRVSYFQGPRFELALVLRVAGPGEGMRIFDTNLLKPPPGADTGDAQAPKP